ncbi:CLUMA_CG021450, isoform A [Clunio marinus]|uniref:CLUMA_CG021450, isoform A n=1 Tax=Clunio marinus TaxID=568069 RepID=A0A1J1J7N2_9DIPT|nr:CLUMA_CG021450, isoform A [Clunio marinus]
MKLVNNLNIKLLIMRSILRLENSSLQIQLASVSETKTKDAELIKSMIDNFLFRFFTSLPAVVLYSSALLCKASFLLYMHSQAYLLGSRKKNMKRCELTPCMRAKKYWGYIMGPPLLCFSRCLMLHSMTLHCSKFHLLQSPNTLTCPCKLLPSLEIFPLYRKTPVT